LPCSGLFSFLPPPLTMARDAYLFLIPLLALLLFFFWAEYIGVAIVLLFLSGFVAYFFRDPERVIPEDSRTIKTSCENQTTPATSSAISNTFK